MRRDYGPDGRLTTFQVMSTNTTHTTARGSWWVVPNARSESLSELHRYSIVLVVPSGWFSRRTPSIRLSHPSVSVVESACELGWTRHTGFHQSSLSISKAVISSSIILQRSAVDLYIDFCSLGRNHDQISTQTVGIHYTNPRETTFTSQL